MWTTDFLGARPPPGTMGKTTLRSRKVEEEFTKMRVLGLGAGVRVAVPVGLLGDVRSKVRISLSDPPGGPETCGIETLSRDVTTEGKILSGVLKEKS